MRWDEYFRKRSNESWLGKTQVTWALPVNLPFANLNPLAVPVIYIVGRTHATGGCKTACSSPAGGGRLGWGWLVGLGKIGFVPPIKPPSPQPSPSGRERGRVVESGTVSVIYFVGKAHATGEGQVAGTN